MRRLPVFPRIIAVLAAVALAGACGRTADDGPAGGPGVDGQETPGAGNTRVSTRPWQLDSAGFLVTGIVDGDPEIFYVRDRSDTLWIRLTWSPGLDNSADWFPDGNAVVFHSERASEERELDLWRTELHPRTGRPTGPPSRLTETPGHDYLPAVSPDGRHVAFLSRRPEPAFPGGSPGQIWLVDADGSNPRRVTRAPITASLGPVWMPDGRSLLVARRMFEKGPTTLSRVWLDLHAPKGDVLGVREAVLVADTFFNYTPHPSPDGSRLAYTAENAAGTRVILTDALGRSPRVLLEDGYNYVEGWTPDGAWVVVTRWYPAFQRRDTWLLSPDSARADRPLLEPAHRSASGVDFRPGG